VAFFLYIESGLYNEYNETKGKTLLNLAHTIKFANVEKDNENAIATKTMRTISIKDAGFE